MILGVLEDVGGRDYLAQCAVQSPSSFLMLLAKVMPTQLTNANDTAVSFDFRWSDAATVVGTALEHAVDADVDTPIEAPIIEEPLSLQQPMRVGSKRH